MASLSMLHSNGTVFQWLDEDGEQNSLTLVRETALRLKPTGKPSTSDGRKVSVPGFAARHPTLGRGIADVKQFLVEAHVVLPYV